MTNIRRMWQPLTATPFLATAAHQELLPCESLQGWIRCFWGWHCRRWRIPDAHYSRCLR